MTREQSFFLNDCHPKQDDEHGEWQARCRGATPIYGVVAGPLLQGMGWPVLTLGIRTCLRVVASEPGSRPCELACIYVYEADVYIRSCYMNSVLYLAAGGLILSNWN
jgi:hypothetical protein